MGLLTWCKAGDLLALWLLGELQFESNPLSPFFRSFFFFDRTMCASIHVRNFVPNMLHTNGRLTERRLVENAQVDRGLLPTIIVCRNRLRSRYLRARPLLERSISRKQDLCNEKGLCSFNLATNRDDRDKEATRRDPEKFDTSTWQM